MILLKTYSFIAVTKILYFVVCGCKITHFLQNAKHFARKSFKKVQKSYYVKCCCIIIPLTHTKSLQIVKPIVNKFARDG